MSNQKPCVECGQYFPLKYQDGDNDLGLIELYCSKACRSKANSRRKRIKRGYDIYVRDGWICQLCLGSIDHKLFGDEFDPWAPTIDHEIPRSRGGSNASHNLQAAHRRCNQEKGDKLNWKKVRRGK